MASHSSAVCAEGLRRHAGVGHGDDLGDALLAGPGQRRHVAGDDRAEGLAVRPAGLLRREGANPVEGEGELGVDRLLHPERAVVVEHGEALLGRHEVGPTFGRRGFEEVEDGSFGGAVPPGRQRVAALLRCRRTRQPGEKQGREDAAREAKWHGVHPFRSGARAARPICEALGLRGPLLRPHPRRVSSAVRKGCWSRMKEARPAVQDCWP